MGVARLERIARSADRRPGETRTSPRRWSRRARLPTQRTVSGTLATIAELAKREQVGSPSITVVGAVAALAPQLSWLSRGPLAGRTVAVTRARAQASGLARSLRELGANVVQAPVVRPRALPGPPLDPAPYDLVCVTSANAADELFARLRAGGRDARSLAGARVASIGPGTTRALAAHGIAADVVPERFVAEGLAEALQSVTVSHALVARARGGRDVLPDALRARGAQVDVLDLYETVAEPPPGDVLARARAADYVTFTSASTVRNFLDAIAEAGTEADADADTEADADTNAAEDPATLSQHTRTVSIGPITSEALRERGLAVDVEASQHDIDGLLAALLADATAR